MIDGHRSIAHSHLRGSGPGQQRTLAPLTPALPLLDSGLDSHCLAVIVARLEERFGFDPFDTDTEVEFPVTVGDFMKPYESAAIRSVA